MDFLIYMFKSIQFILLKYLFYKTTLVYDQEQIISHQENR